MVGHAEHRQAVSRAPGSLWDSKVQSLAVNLEAIPSFNNIFKKTFG